MDILENHRPGWYFASLLISFGYPFLIPAFARRAADARLVAAFPIIGNAMIVPLAVVRLLRDLDASGYVPKTGGAIAAGLAEAIFPLCIGAIVSALLSLVVRLHPAWADIVSRRTWLGTLALILSAIGTTAIGAFVWYLRPRSGNYRAGLADIAALPLAVSGLAFALAIVALVWPKPRPSRAARPSVWFLSFAATSGVIAAGAWLVVARLTRFALTGGLP